ncbi:sensor histidine kinase [Saccharopolyspora rosea]|uniref:histidine kinase n=1 Tax=Saccharopolyspora rosea TaxID=524884 RepID=A0ABW3FNP7_9PSEU|nr:HAMP domain-containing sensor histidine kinase [Saccharopolyspora rosea]
MLIPVRLRTKLSLAIAAVVAVTGTTLGFAVHEVTLHNRLDQTRSEVDARLTVAARSYLDTGTPTVDSALDDPAVPAPLDAAARAGQRATFLDMSTSTVWAATSVGGRTLSVHDSLAATFAAVDGLDRTLLVAGVGAVAGSSVLGVVVANGLSRRLRRTADIARAVAAGDLDARVGDPAAHRWRGGRGDGSTERDRGRIFRRRDEAAELAGALDGMAAALQDRLEAERRVAADVAHELRTPVAGLVTAAELLPDERAVELVRDRVSLLRGLVEDLLEVSRLDAAAETAELDVIDVGELARHCLRGVADVTVHGSPEDAVAVLTDPRRVERIVSNLVANSRIHGHPPIELHIQGRSLIVRDHGPGYPEFLLSEGPRRFRTGDPERGHGHGLGLTIASGQAAVLGADLTFANAADGGAQATLTLPPAEF